MASDTYHEPLELLSEDTKNTHRAIVSLMEELEAIDWYQQRAEACSDPELSAVLTHNKNEEVEHAMMTLEWLRRKVPVFDDNIGTYLNSSGPILEVEAAITSGASGNGEGGSGAGGKVEGGASGKGEGGTAKKSEAKSGKSYNTSESLGIGSLKGNK
ncbi:MAG TPA: ferritin-like domain-containing protein [Polyangiaceae bacterium]|nr:ferritin-like domain-containing protein [Polyangiaceae bacterium]